MIPSMTPPAASPASALDAEGTRAAILDAATAVFIERGFAGASMSTIARQAGVTKSLIHHHFGSKQDLWDAVKLRCFSEYSDRQKEMLQNRAPTLDLIEDSMRIYFHFLRDHPDFARLMTWMAVEEDRVCTTLNDELALLGIARIREGQELGHIRSDLPPEHILATFFSLIRHWFTSPKMLPGDGSHHAQPEAAEAYLETAVRIFVDGIRPRT